MLMAEVELLEHHSEFNGGEGKEVLTWKNTSHGANDREMKEKQNSLCVQLLRMTSLFWRKVH